MNNVNLIGRLTRKPELEFLKTGHALCKFGLAVSGMKKDEVDFFDCEAWSKTAELIEKYFDKGSQIAFSGRLKQDRWEKDGKKFSKIKIIVSNVTFVGSKNDSQEKYPENKVDNSRQNDYDYESEVTDDGIPY